MNSQEFLNMLPVVIFVLLCVIVMIFSLLLLRNMRRDYREQAEDLTSLPNKLNYIGANFVLITFVIGMLIVMAIAIKTGLHNG